MVIKITRGFTMNKKLNLFLGMCVATAFQLANNSCLATPLAGSSPKTSPKQIVFIDKSIKNYQQLSNDIQSNKHPNSTLLVPLDANNNAILEITKYLENYKNLDAIHLISHGFSGGLNFGNNAIDINTLNTQRSQLSLWRNALTQKGDILLYGCNVAKDKTGRDFINTLAKITHADIAASNNTTGNPRLGQDWLLEKQVGAVETAALFDNTHHQFTATLDILNENAFLYGNNIEVGIGPDGAFGSDISSPEMGRKSYGKLLGYISDPSGGQFKNSYHGDFFYQATLKKVGPLA